MTTATILTQTAGWSVSETDRWLFNEWFSESIAFDTRTILKLSQCYESYVHKVALGGNQIPMSKRRFSLLLRRSLADLAQQGQVLIIGRSGVKIYGIKFFNNLSCSSSTMMDLLKN